MQNPIEVVKGWSKSAKRYAFVSVALAIWLFSRNDGFQFYGWTSLLFIPLLITVMAPVMFFMLGFTVDLVHRIIHWLEDDERLA